MHPENPNEATFGIVCDKHGIVEKGAQDRAVATLVRDEHLEQCPGPCEIIEYEGDEFEPATALDEEDDVDEDGDEIECQQDGCLETFECEAAMFGHLASHGDRRGEKA